MKVTTVVPAKNEAVQTNTLSTEFNAVFGNIVDYDRVSVYDDSTDV
jgi:hypothetical protein